MKQSIAAVLYRKDRKTGLRRLVFDTEEQDGVETAMTRLGYGCQQYWLSLVPRVDGRKSRVKR